MNGTKISTVRDDSVVARLCEDFEYFDRNDNGLMEYEEFMRFLGAPDSGTAEEEYRIGWRDSP